MAMEVCTQRRKGELWRTMRKRRRRLCEEGEDDEEDGEDGEGEDSEEDSGVLSTAASSRKMAPMRAPTDLEFIQPP